MKEVRIFVWCDPCDEEDGTRVEGQTTEPLSVDPRKPPRTLDVCEQHDKALVAPLRELLAARGALPTDDNLRPPRSPGASATTKKWTCPLCEVEFTRSAAIVHIWGVHRKGETRPTQPEVCPDCSYPDGKKFTEAGMAMHRRRSHGYDVITEALDGAKR